jgi:hypothetical protein
VYQGGLDALVSETGSITPGKLADMIVLSPDLLTIPPNDIPNTEVLYTIVNGNVVYEKK